MDCHAGELISSPVYNNSVLKGLEWYLKYFINLIFSFFSPEEMIADTCVNNYRGNKSLNQKTIRLSEGPPGRRHHPFLI